MCEDQNDILFAAFHCDIKCTISSVKKQNILSLHIVKIKEDIWFLNLIDMKQKKQTATNFWKEFCDYC